MLRSKLVLVLACTVLLACAQDMSRRERLVQQQLVEERLQTWVRFQNNRKLDSLELMYHQVPELRALGPDGQRREGWEEQRAAIHEFYGGIQYMNLVITEPEVQVLSPRYAVATFGHSTDIVQRGGVRLPVVAGNGTIVWVKDSADNTWKIHVQQIAVNAPAEN